jgi:CheY-like chemotaxis protein
MAPTVRYSPKANNFGGGVTQSRNQKVDTPSSKLILIVEDFEDDAKLLQVLLTNCGIVNPVRIALSAEEAMNYLVGGPPFAHRTDHPLPGVIFVDLKLPGISGFDLLRWVKQHPELKNTFIVVLSATGDLMSVQAAYSLGTNSFLIKPCRRVDLENLIICYPNFWERAIPPAQLQPPSAESPPTG